MFGASIAFALGEDVSALREKVRRWVQERVTPLAAEIDKGNQFPARLCVKWGT